MRIAAGDRQAVDEFITRFGGLIWSISRRQIANREEAEEVVQEIFLEIWRNAARYNERVGSEETFVALIARRRLIDHRRRQQRTIATTSISTDLDRIASGVHDSYEFGSEVEWAREQLALLPSTERQIIELAIDSGLSHKQIAERLGLPLGTVKTTARRGLARLRELVTQCPPQPRVERVRL
jgi:RNA polymerase sigma factor (sigma-70 family)